MCLTYDVKLAGIGTCKAVLNICEASFTAIGLRLSFEPFYTRDTRIDFRENARSITIPTECIVSTIVSSFLSLYDSLFRRYCTSLRYLATRSCKSMYTFCNIYIYTRMIRTSIYVSENISFSRKSQGRNVISLL